jgi:hypothetical protein
MRHLHCKLASAALYLLFVLCFAQGTAQAKAPQPQIEISGSSAFDSSKGPASAAAEFDTRQVRALGLLIKVRLPGGGGGVQADIFYSIKDSAGEQIAKIKEQRVLNPGDNELSFGEVARLDEVLGEDRYVFDLEVTAKGYSGAKGALSVELHGPPAPELRITRLELRNEEGKRTAYFEPGERFRVDIAFSAGDNESGLKPRLELHGGLVTNYASGYSSDNTNSLSGAVGGEFALQAGLEGEYRLEAHGQVPKFFDNPEGDQHAFSLIGELFVGKHRLDVDSRLGVVLDTRSKKERVKNGWANRSFELDEAENWELVSD